MPDQPDALPEGDPFELSAEEAEALRPFLAEPAPPPTQALIELLRDFGADHVVDVLVAQDQ